jgi:hypothetical protein
VLLTNTSGADLLFPAALLGYTKEMLKFNSKSHTYIHLTSDNVFAEGSVLFVATSTNV